jgi:hypothetical protein
MTKIQPKDIIALCTIIFIFAMKAKGLNGDLDAILAFILGYYFVKRATHKDSGK